MHSSGNVADYLRGNNMLQANELSAAKPTMPPTMKKADVSGDAPVTPKPAERGRQVLVVRTKKHGYQAMLRGPDGTTIGEPKTGLTREQAEALTPADFEPKPKPKVAKAPAATGGTAKVTGSRLYATASTIKVLSNANPSREGTNRGRAYDWMLNHCAGKPVSAYLAGDGQGTLCKPKYIGAALSKGLIELV